MLQAFHNFHGASLCIPLATRSGAARHSVARSLQTSIDGIERIGLYRRLRDQFRERPPRNERATSKRRRAAMRRRRVHSGICSSGECHTSPRGCAVDVIPFVRLPNILADLSDACDRSTHVNGSLGTTRRYRVQRRMPRTDAAREGLARLNVD